MTDFQTYRLHDLGRIVTGRTPPNNDDAYYGELIDFLTPSDFSGARTVSKTQRKLSAYGAEKLGRCIVNSAVGVSCIGWQMGQSVLIERPTVTNQQINSLIVDTKLADLRFVYYNLLSRRDEIFALGAGGSRTPILNKSDFGKLPIQLPDLARQQQISAFLGLLDDKIELDREMNETLEAMAQAIFRDWFVDFGPTRRKLDGATDPLTIMGGLVQDTARAQALADLFPAALGDDGLPEGWAERAFGAFVEIIGGGTPKTSNESYWKGSIPWFSVTDTPPKGSIFVDVTEKTISKEGLANSSARLVRAGTTIISARGTVGNLALTPHEMTFNQSCYGLQGNAAVGDCFVFLAAQNIVERLKGMAHGSVFSTITRSTFDNVQLPYTPDEIFEAFESLARPIFDKVLGNVKESRTLAATRDLLLPKLMSGEIRLSEAEDLMEAAQ